MKKELTINEARKLFDSEKVFATDSGFIFNDFGKYRPNLTFVLDREFCLDKDGKVVNPIQYIKDHEVTDSFNLDLNGEAKILFGDFWRSRKGGACFRPKDPKGAKHILVRVDWGGAFNRSRGFNGDGVADRGAMYFRVASSNGGGSGYDYWILPVGYVHQHGTQVYRIDWESAKAYCEKHSQLQADQRAEADHNYKRKLLNEEMSRRNRETIAPRLEEIEQELAKLRKRYPRVTKINLEETGFRYGQATLLLLYTQENLADAEATLVRQTEWVATLDAQKLAEQRAYEEFAPKFEALQERAEAVGFAIQANHDEVRLILDSSNYVKDSYSYDVLEKFEQKIRAEEKKLEAQRQATAKLEREAEAKSMGLPSDIRIWKRTGSRTGCSKGWVIDVNGVDRERDEIFNENSRRAQRYDEGFEIWHQILPGELVIQWSKSCTAAEHECEIVHCPEKLTDAQIERVAEIQESIEEEWKGLTGLASKKESPSIGDGWLGLLT